MKDLFNIDAEGRAIDRALKSVLAKARAAGIARPSLYFESEGDLHVFDEDHPESPVNGPRGDHQEAVVASTHIPTPHDVGAW